MSIVVDKLLASLNSQQLAAVKSDKGIVRVIAGAGSGKTTCITAKISYEIEKGMNPEKILSLTFTKRAGAELKQRLRGIIGDKADKLFAGTFHSFAHSNLMKVLTYTLITENDSYDIIKTLIEGYNKFPYPVDELIQVIGYHRNLQIPFTDAIVQNVAVLFKQFKVKNNLKDFDDLLEDFLLLVRKGLFKFDFEMVVADEGQDTNKIQNLIIKEFLKTQTVKNLFVVGDAAQCLIKGTEIDTESGIKTIENLSITDKTKSSNGKKNIYTEIDEIKKRKYKGKIVAIKTESGKILKSTPDHTHFSGFSHKKMNSWHFVYLMYKKGYGFRIGKTQTHLGARKNGLEGRTVQEVADCSWIISSHKSDDEARLHEAYHAASYGIPTIQFRTRYGNGHGGMRQEYIDALYNSVDSETGAKKLLEEHEMFIEYPTHRPKSSHLRKRSIVTLCGSGNLHRISCHGSEHSEASILKENGFSIRKSKQDGWWRYETAFKDFGNCLNKVHLIQHLIGSSVILKCKFKDEILHFMPASHIKPGMVVYTENGLEEVTQTWLEDYDGYVYDINLKNYHNFLANGIFTHNCIYSWRGSDLQSFLDWGTESCKDYPLAINYRSTQEVLKVANRILKGIPESARVELIPIKDYPDAPKAKLIRVGDPQDEVNYIVNKIRELHAAGKPYDSMAVLYRAHFISQMLQMKLAELRIPCTVWSEQNVLTAFHIQDVMCFLRAYVNPKDVMAWSRVFRVLPKIGKVKGHQIAEEVLKKGIFNVSGFPIEPVQDIYRASGHDAFLDAVERFYVPIVRFNYPDENRDLAVKKFIDLARANKDLKKFVTDIMISNADEKESNGVILTTIHQSKGLEWDTVFVMGIYDGVFPSYRTTNMDEETRLLYVAVTRAQRNLFCMFPERTGKGNAVKSRFYSLITRVPE